MKLEPQQPLREPERENYSFFLELPDPNREQIGRMDVKGTQFREPLIDMREAQK